MSIDMKSYGDVTVSKVMQNNIMLSNIMLSIVMLSIITPVLYCVLSCLLPLF
jgi:hypothetical protein